MQNKYRDQLDEDIQRHSELICAYFDKLRTNLLDSTDQFVFDAYKAQVLAVISPSAAAAVAADSEAAGSSQTTASQRQQKGQRQALANQNVLLHMLTQKKTQTTPTQSSQSTSRAANVDPSALMPMYQCLLGSIECLMEHYLSQSSYKYKITFLLLH